MSRVIPREFEEVYVRVFTRRKDQARVMKSVFLKVRCVYVNVMDVFLIVLLLMCYYYLMV